MQTKFSVIIPTYNHAHLIGRCLDSLLAQLYKNWEAIVVNNASTDNTLDVVKSYNDDRIKCVQFNNDQGIAASRNFGIKSASGDFICFLDSDDWWREDKLQVCKKYIDEGYNFLYHSLEMIYSSKAKTPRRQYINVRPVSKGISFTEDVLMNGNFIPNSSVVVSRKLVDKTGGLDEDLSLKAVEDLEYWIRVFKNNDVRPKCIEIPLGYYWIGGNTSARIEQIDRYNSLFEKYVEELDNADKVKKAIKHKKYLEARVYHSNKKFSKAIQRYRESLCWLNISRSLKAIIGMILGFFRIKK